MAQHNNTSLIKRVKRNTNFTHLSNEVFNAGLSPDSLGVLCYILHLPDDWVIHKTHLQKVFNIGREKMDRIFKEIEKSGFLISADMIRVGGKYVGRNYFFYDEPQKPSPSEPLSANPSSANTQLLNTNIELNTNNTNNPLNPLKGENEIDLFGLDFNSWIEAYIRIHRRFGVDKKRIDINEHWFKRQLLKLNEQAIDNQLPLTALMNILQDRWEREHRFPSALPKKLFNMDNVQRWAVRIHNVMQ